MATKIINLVDLDGSNGFRMDGVAAYDSLGFVSNAGDINGDGFDDVIVSGSHNSTGATSTHYIIFGKSSIFAATVDITNLDGSNGFRLDPLASGFFGSGASSAGDFNGDGVADLIVGDPSADPNGADSGSSYVVFGKTSDFSATLSLSSIDGNNGFRLDGEAIRDISGSFVGTAGDVNGDGLDDVIISADFADPNGNSAAGSSYVVFGKTSEFNTSMDLSSLDGSNGFRLDGVSALDFSHGTNAGDVNGDGFDDLIVNASGADPNGESSGSTYVVFGKASGFAATTNLSSLNGNNGFRLDGIAAYDQIVGTNAGDINGDGFGDIIIGAVFASPNGTYSGSSYVVFGKAAGFEPTMSLSNLNGNNGFRVDGTAAYDFLGSVSSAGDVNGDGFDDVIIGAAFADSNGVDSGSTYVMFGKASGFDAELDLVNFDSNDGFRLDGAAAGDQSGIVSNAGDVNGDGFADLMVGAPSADPNGSYSGSSYVVFGGNFNGKVTAMGTAGADKLKGGKGVDRMVAGDGDDILSGRGGKDVFHGGGGDDTIEIRDTKFRLADGGAGLDTLKLDDSHLNLNLTKERGHISDIEVIDLKGNGSNKLTLTALDVLNLSSTSNTLIVDGNRNDRVVARDNGWEDGGIHHGYHTFTNGEATLLIGVHVATDFG